MHQRGVNGFRGVKKYVFERGYIVGEMNCFADTSLKRSEFFIEQLNFIDKFI